jgi:hypothetical protein
MFFSPLFQKRLITLPKLTIAGMKKNTLIKHKEVVVIFEESGHVCCRC